MKTFTLIRLSFLLLGFTSMASCGRPPMVTNVVVNPRYEADELFMQMTADLEIGKVNLQPITLPILMPKTFEEIGYIQLLSDFAGKNQMSVDINVTKVSKLDAKEARLPNGSLIPLIGTNKSFTINIRDKANLYLTIGDGRLALGASIAIRGLDQIGEKTGTSAVMPVFNIQQVQGSAGLYLSKEKGKNGFAIVADTSALLDQVDFIMLEDPYKEQEPVVFNYSGLSANSSDKRIIDRQLLKMNQRRETLRVH
jgi:hypothetical protein